MPGTKSTEDLPPTLPLFRNKSIVMPDPESSMEERELISDGGEKGPSFLKRISFQIRLIEATTDERGEPNGEPAGRPAMRLNMVLGRRSSLTSANGF